VTTVTLTGGQEVDVHLLATGPAELTFDNKVTKHVFTAQDATVSDVVVERLVDYAHKRLCDLGFMSVSIPASWKVSVETLDGDKKPSQRSFNVYFTNHAGGTVGVTQIYTRSGWPFLDHGLCIEERPR